jgi:hypothetical protein
VEAMAQWFDDYADDEDELQIDEYDITATPNDFNVSTLFNFIESGAVRIPGFQRNFVWDQVRASKLIESLILGIPVPQLFLYEQARNRFLVIDGQQRLMSIYYFIKRKFPRKEKRVEIRAIFDKEGKIPDEVLHMVAVIKQDMNMTKSILDFLEIGRERNRLVHQDYGTFFLEKSAEEIFGSYASAMVFVDFVPKALRDFSAKLQAISAA